MAVKKKKKFFERIIFGSEKAEGYARSTLPSTRWEQFWDILKGNFGKLFLVNLIVLLTLVPVLFVFYMRYGTIVGYSTVYPFSQGFGLGYMAPNSLVGYPESIIFSSNISSLIFLPIAFIIASIGISGGAYVVRNMIWTEGVFVANDFVRGIKTNYKQILKITFLFSMLFYLFMAGISLCNVYIAQGGSTWIYSLIKYMIILLLVMSIFMCLHMISQTITYDLTFRQLLKNSFLFTIALLPYNIVFIIAGILPAGLLYLGSLLTVIGILFYLIIGVAWFLLVWFEYSQWSFDKFVNPRIPTAKKNRGIYEKVKASNEDSLKKYKQQIALADRSAYSLRPIKPITDDDIKIEELPASFNRRDIIKLAESKQNMYDDHEKFVKEHINDEQYVIVEDEETLKLKEKQNKAIEKAKKELSKRKKN